MNKAYKHPAFPKPDRDDLTIWKYMDFAKFEWLIENKRLFMPVATKLGEPLEGTEPVGNDVWWREQLRNAISDRQRYLIKRNKNTLAKFGAKFRNHYYVSSWHINENENNRMWHAYTQTSDSVAIQTTHNILQSLLPNYVEIGVVRYIDYNNESLPSLNRFEYITHKHVNFCFERELRAVAFPPPKPELGGDHFNNNLFDKEEDPSFKVFAPEIEVQTLICNILVHPESSSCFKRNIFDVCERNSLTIPNISLFDTRNV
jgi:hypothetical protein